jgi:hypothetical protein
MRDARQFVNLQQGYTLDHETSVPRLDSKCETDTFSGLVAI